MLRRARSWIQTGKRRKGVLGSRGEAKRVVTGKGVGEEKKNTPTGSHCLFEKRRLFTNESVIGVVWSLQIEACQ